MTGIGGHLEAMLPAMVVAVATVAFPLVTGPVPLASGAGLTDTRGWSSGPDDDCGSVFSR